MTDNPLADFVELPDEYRELEYCNLLCGVVRGALDMVGRDAHHALHILHRLHAALLHRHALRAPVMHMLTPV